MTCNSGVEYTRLSLTPEIALHFYHLMTRTLTILAAIFLACLVLAALGGLFWANNIAVKSQPIEKDFLVPWLGARTFLQYGDDPYGDPATQRAQIVYYGKLAADGQDPLVLWLPLPVELFYFPIALVKDYTLARTIWQTCVEIALVALAFSSMRLAGWKPGRLLLPVVLLFPLAWVYGAITLTSGSAAAFVALALAGFLLALRKERDELAGGLLIFLVSAARLTGILSIFIFWWVFYQRRWRVLWGFLMGLAVLLALSFLFLPGWFLPFLRGLMSHYAYSPAFTTTGILAGMSPIVGLRFGWVLAGILLLVLFFEWGTTLRKDFRTFVWTTCLTISLTPLVSVPLAPREYPILAIPLILIMAMLAERRPWIKSWGLAGMIMVVIVAGSWWLTLGLAGSNAYTTLANSLILLMPILLTAGLAWMRWWFIHPKPGRQETVA